MKVYGISKSKEYSEELKRTLVGGVHHNFSYRDRRTPLNFVRGKNSRLWDIDGNEYLDLFAKFGAMILGHNNQEYNEALDECIHGVISVDLTGISMEACEVLHKYIPSCEMIRFGLSGTEMVQNAIRLARAYTKKNKVLRFEGHFHGTADNILGGTTDSAEHPIPKDDGKGAFSTAGRAKGVLEKESILIPWNDIDILQKTVHRYADDIAAVITEPVSVNGGSIVPVKGFLEGLREICDKNNIVLIFDELITGVRMGLGGAQAYYGVIPDLSIWGKSISNGGIPVSFIAGKREIMSLYEDAKVIHGGTYNGYPLGLAAVKATFEVLSKNEEEHYSNMKHYARQIYDILLEEARNIGLYIVVQGPETCTSYHCNDSPIESYQGLTEQIKFKNGIIRECLAAYGILVSSISRIYPNISLNDNDICFFKERIGYALSDAKMVIDRLGDKKIGNR